MSFIRGKKPHIAKTIIPIAGATKGVAGFASKLSQYLANADVVLLTRGISCKETGKAKDLAPEALYLQGT